MRKILILIFMLFTLTGCWNYKELNEYSIVSGIAIDKSNDEYEVSVLISNMPKNSSSESNSESNIVVYSGTGDSIVKCLKEIGLISSNELYLGNFSILVLSEEVAKDGINNVIDFFLRYSDAEKNFYLLISRDSNAKDTLKIMTPLSNFPSQSMTDNVKSTTELQGIIARTSFNDLVATLLKDGINPTINSIKIIGDKSSGYNTDNLKESEPKSYVKLDTLAIFKDDKLINWTTRDESLGINIINNKIDEMYLKVDYENGYIVIDTTDFSSKRKVNIVNDKPKVTINVSGEAKIIELNGNIDLENEKVINELKRKANELIKEKINLAIDLAIKNNTDVFGLGLSFSKEFPKYFNEVKDNWDNNLNNIDFEINSNLIFKNKQASKNSLESINERKES